MVSLRCKMMVKEEFKKLGLHFVIVEVLEGITLEKRNKLIMNLLNSGLELLDDKTSILIEKIKT